MLTKNDQSNLVVREQLSSTTGGPSPLEYKEIIAAVRRQAFCIIAGLCVGLFVGEIYNLTAVRRYTAVTQLLIDSKKGHGSGVSADTLADLSIDTSAIDSQVEVIKSEKIASTVINDLQLLETPDDEILKASQGTLVSKIQSLFSLDNWFGGGTVADVERKAKLRDTELQFLTKNLTVKRVGRTYVLEIGFTALSPQKAALYSNAFAKAYLDDQFDSNYEVTRRASDWLLARIQELKQKSLEADFAVQKFKADKGLISTGKDGLVSDQQLTEINSQLIVARGEVAHASAKVDRITAILASGETDGAVSESIANPIIIDLRNKYLTAAKQEAELSAKLGKNHVQAVKLRSEMQEYNKLILNELSRIAESSKSELDIAVSREKALEASLAQQVGLSGNVNQDLVTLREFERESDTYKNLYQNLLQRYQETVQKQSFPISEARVISAAPPNNEPSFPNKPIVRVLGLLFGLLIGAAVALFREYSDRGFRTAAQIRNYLGVEFLGMLPAMGSKQVGKQQKLKRDADRALMPPIMLVSLNAPLSGFTETLRGTKVAVDITLTKRKTKVIGFLSLLPGEGKSTVSKNFASLISNLGVRTILIDGDMRNPGLTRALQVKPEAGLFEVLMDGRPYQDVAITEPESGLVIIPAVIKNRVTHTSELIGSIAMGHFIDELSQDFDYIIIDLPPLGPVVDARSAAKYIDGFVFVIEWGKTARDTIANTLRNDDIIMNKCIGAILNKVDYESLKLYDNYGSKEYYYGKYGSYYGTSSQARLK